MQHCAAPDPHLTRTCPLAAMQDAPGAVEEVGTGGHGQSADQFKREVAETFLRCIKEKISHDNAVIELNGLKIAEDRTFADCARCGGGGGASRLTVAAAAATGCVPFTAFGVVPHLSGPLRCSK